MKGCVELFATAEIGQSRDGIDSEQHQARRFRNRFRGDVRVVDKLVVRSVEVNKGEAGSIKGRGVECSARGVNRRASCSGAQCESVAFSGAVQRAAHRQGNLEAAVQVTKSDRDRGRGSAVHTQPEVVGTTSEVAQAEGRADVQSSRRTRATDTARAEIDRERLIIKRGRTAGACRERTGHSKGPVAGT